MSSPELILASTSRYRHALLGKLGLEFKTDTPDCDEAPLPQESAEALVQRLAHGKAQSLAQRYPQALIIGSDQVACLDEQVLGKPGGRTRAIEQLTACSGRTVTFYTGLCLYHAASGRARTLCEPYHVHFRPLTLAQIERYVDREQPYDCAGSFKSEGYGISLFNALEGRDPNSLIGLPLMALIEALAEHGIQVP